MLNILLFGAPADIGRNLSAYLGNNSKSQSSIVYFEFPNEKFQHPTILKNFPEKMKIYLLQQGLMQTMLAPKREFNAANFAIWLFDWDLPQSLEEGFEYVKKIIETRKSFIPILLIGIRKKESENSENHINFLKYFQFHLKLQSLIQLPVWYCEITETKTENQIFVRLKSFISHYLEQFGEHHKITQYSTIAIEEIMKEIQGLLKAVLSEQPEFDDLLGNLAIFELDFKRPITRRLLTSKYGSTLPNARKIIDLWNYRPLLAELPPEALEQLKKEGNEAWNACDASCISPNLIELIHLGVKPSVAQYVLRYLYENGRITTISHHIESLEFVEFTNIREFVVVHEGRTLYLKTTNPNTDQTLMFSDMIQAIEMIRNDYISRHEGHKSKKINNIEFLEFGDLRALIGNGQKGVKVIIRLTYRPRNEDTLRQRVKNFLVSYENQVPLLPTTDVNEQKQIRQMSDKIFFSHFNPFPITLDAFKQLKVKPYPDFALGNLTKIEQQLVEILRSNKEMVLENLVDEMANSYNFAISRSDVLQFVLDLIDDNIIG